MVSTPTPAAAASSPIVMLTKLCQLLAQRSYAPGADEALPHLAVDEEWVYFTRPSLGLVQKCKKTP